MREDKNMGIMTTLKKPTTESTPTGGRRTAPGVPSAGEP